MKRIATAFAFCLLTPCVEHPAVGAELSADKLLALTHVMEVEIEMSDDNWKTLCGQTRDFRNAFSNPSAKPYTYFEGNVKIDGVEINRVGVRKKGFIGSQDSVRPSLKISFDEFQEQKPVEGTETLTLNNNKQDRSLLSQCMTYQLFRKAGVHAPRCNYATVTVNGEYLGIYSHVESVKKPFLVNEFGDSSGRLYEGTLSDLYPKAVHRLEAKNRAAEDRGNMMKLAKLLEKEGPLDMEVIDGIVDVENFLKFWAIESLIGFWDGYTQNQNNYFMYENPGNGKLYFMPWGADSCFSAAGGFRRFRGNTSNVVTADSMLANRLFNTPGIPERYKKTLEWVLDEVWNEEELIAETDRIFALIEDEFDFPQLDALTAMNSVQDFVRGRRRTIVGELERNWPIQVSAKPRKPFYQVELGTAKGSFSSKWNETATEGAKSQLTFDGRLVSDTGNTVSVREQEPMRFRGFGPPPSQNPPASIVIVYPRGDEPDMALTVIVPRDKFAANQKVMVSGSFDDGEQRQRSFPGMGTSVTGSVTLSAAGMQDGDPIVGDFDLRITKMRGGFMDRGR